MILLSAWSVAGASETIAFDTANPVTDAVRRLEGKLGVPISVDLGPTLHWLQFPGKVQKGPFSVTVPSGPSGLSDSLQAVVDGLSRHPSWDGCLRLEVRSDPWTVQATQVAEVGPNGNVTGCVPYASPLDVVIRARDARGARSLGAMCAELSILREDPLDPIPDSAKLEHTTLRGMLAQSQDWSFRFSEGVLPPRTWRLTLARPGDRIPDLDPQDYPFHRSHASEKERTERDLADPSRQERLEALRSQRSEKEALLNQAEVSRTHPAPDSSTTKARRDPDPPPIEKTSVQPP